MVCRGQLVVKILKESKRAMAIDIGGMRKPYLSAKDAFDIKDLIAREPYSQFHHWFEQAKETPGIEEANAMCLATATKSGLPSSRMLLLKVLKLDFLKEDKSDVLWLFRHSDLPVTLTKVALYSLPTMRAEKAKSWKKIQMLH